MMALSLLSCKQEEKEETTAIDTEKTPSLEEQVPEGQEVFRGEFIYLADAAVLTTRNDIYAVKIDEKMHELNKVAEALKKTEFDMVNVVVFGTLGPNPMKEESGEGWDQMLTVKKVIEVTPAKNNNVIQSGSSIDIKDVK